MTRCQRCGVEDRPDRFTYRLVDLEAEAQQDGRPHEGPVYARQDRCRGRGAGDRAALGVARDGHAMTDPVMTEDEVASVLRCTPRQVRAMGYWA